jgi:hypothetical protein
MITATFDLYKATPDEIDQARVMIDQVSNSLPVSSLQINIVEPEVADNLELPFLKAA